jgi:CheY-like chemotaxis protein
MGTILVVDDDLDVLELIEIGLGGEGHALVFANSGTDALAKFEAQPVDLVISDLKMPGIDGIATIIRMRERDATLPAIMVTGYMSPHTIEECSQLGGIQLIRKPFTLSELSSLVDTSLNRARRSPARAGRPEP